MRKIFLVTSLAVLFNFCLFPYRVYTSEETDELRLYLGEIKVLAVSNPKRVVVGNPAIADVSSVTKDTITLNPKSAGSTNLVLWDNFGEQSYRIKVFAEDMEGIKLRIDNLLARLDLESVTTKAEEDEGKVLLLGNVKTPEVKDMISLALGPLKDKTVDLIKIKEEESVVNIEVKVLELNKDATGTLGLTNPLMNTSNNAATGMTLTEVGSAGITGAKWSHLFSILNLKHDAFTWTLYALVQEGKARILSQPNLACQSGKEAELLVGGEKPVFTTTVAATTGSSGTEVEYKEYGIKLKIKPVVTEDKRIKLAVSVDVSEVGTAEYIGQSAQRTAQAYPLTKRSAATELYLDNGQTMAIGGLMKQKEEEDISKTPWLGDIPVLGMFFRKKITKTGGGTSERGNVELFITLTPTIISEGKGAVALQEPGQKKEEKPAEPAASAAEEDTSAALEKYTGLIQKQILEKLSYPAAAREAGLEGTVKLSLLLSSKGELLEAKIDDSSGSQILDDNALAVAKGIVSYPAFPSSIQQKEIWISIPIVYQLD